MSDRSKQALFDYAVGRTPHRGDGAAFLTMLSEIVEDGQPTPQVAYNDTEVVCDWMVDGWEYTLHVDTDGRVFAFESHWAWNWDEGWESEDPKEIVSVLRERLTLLGNAVKNPLV